MKEHAKAREYITDDGVNVYCSDIIQAVWCPYTDKLVDILDECLLCKNSHDEAYGWKYCLRPSTPTAKTGVSG